MTERSPRRLFAHSKRRTDQKRSRRLTLESLEARQMLSLETAGDLLVDLKATNPSAATATWENEGTLDDFTRIGNPVVEEILGVTAVHLNSDNPNGGWDDAYQGELAPASVTGNSTRSIEVWAYNPNDGLQSALETMVAWGRRGGPGGTNLAFAYGNHGTWGAVGHWGGPDMPWFPGGGSPTLGQWHHLAYTFDGSTTRVYADGVMTNSEVTALNTHTGTTINLGAQNGNGGVIDLGGGEPGSLALANVRVHTGVLSDVQVMNNFNEGVQVAADKPNVTDDAYDATEDTQLVVNAAAGVLDNDDDPAMLPITAVLEDDAADGVLALAADGSFTYQPNPDFFGTDSFTYRADNGLVQSNPATVTITVAAAADPAVAVADNYIAATSELLSVDAADGVLTNDENPDGVSLAAQLVAAVPAGEGSVSLAADGSFDFTPGAGFTGTTSFTYEIDYGGGSPSNTIAVSILVDTPPVANDDSYDVAEDATLDVSAALGVLTNDDDDEDDTLGVVLVDSVGNGVLNLNTSDGSFQYTPNENFDGSDSFTYRADDGDQTSANIATVTINVLAENDPPAASADSYFGFEGESLLVGASGGVLSNDFDPDGPSLEAVLDENVSDGTLTLNPDGSLTYVPNPGFIGVDSFTYHADDSLSQSDIVTVSLIVNSSDQQIVINEINYDPPDNTVPAEFIELYNAGTNPVDLSNWFFSQGFDYTIPAGTAMQPGDH